MVTTPPQDLQARWCPSDVQIAEATTVLGSTTSERVFTIHLLVNKQPHVWTPGVQVRPLVGHVYTDRTPAIQAAELARQAAGEVSAFPISAGWTVHYRDGAWAVFEV
jgi:hypothetical protein